jgi:hypothetical protein
MGGNKAADKQKYGERGGTYNERHPYARNLCQRNRIKSVN